MQYFTKLYVQQAHWRWLFSPVIAATTPEDIPDDEDPSGELQQQLPF